jgi:hypothetical protein
MAETRRVIGGSLARGIASIDDTDDVATVVAVTTGWTGETTQRDKARSQVLWLVDQARRAAQNGRADDAGWWSDRAIGALWNTN